MMSRVAVIGDVHGNVPALSAALSATEHANRLVLLGDLLSYGPDVEGILALVEAAFGSRDTVLLRGNHDRFYEDIEDHVGDTESLPDWIRESVMFVAERLDAARFRRLPWRDDYSLHSIVFAHANPFGLGDWTYLNVVEDHSRAVDVLRQRGSGVGVFGHTHRARCYHHSRGDYRLERPPIVLQADWDELYTHPWVLNAGAVGQPRDEDTNVYVLWLTIESDSCCVRFQPISYDRDAHIDALRRAPLSEETRPATGELPRRGLDGLRTLDNVPAALAPRRRCGRGG